MAKYSLRTTYCPFHYIYFKTVLLDEYQFTLELLISFVLYRNYMPLPIRGVSDVGFSIFADTDADFAF